MINESLKAISEHVKIKFVQYVSGLIIIQKKKTCTEMAKGISVSHDSLNRTLHAHDLLLCIPQAFIELVTQLFMLKKGG